MTDQPTASTVEGEDAVASNVTPLRPDVCAACRGRQRRIAVDGDGNPQDLGPCPECAWSVYERAWESADTARAHLDSTFAVASPVILADDRRMRAEVLEWEAYHDHDERPPLDLVAPTVDALAAAEELRLADTAYAAALDRVVLAVGNLVWAQRLRPGRVVRSPFYPEALTVASVEDGYAGNLSTVTLSRDGKPVANGRHDAPLDQSTMLPVDDPDCTPVYFERWWGHGLRVSGTAHPSTRGVLDVERIG